MSQQFETIKRADVKTCNFCPLSVDIVQKIFTAFYVLYISVLYCFRKYKSQLQFQLILDANYFKSIYLSNTSLTI